MFSSGLLGDRTYTDIYRQDRQTHTYRQWEEVGEELAKTMVAIGEQRAY